MATGTDHTGSRGLPLRGAAGAFLAILVVAAGAVLHLARQRESHAWESLWAEDGSVFLTDAYRDFDGTLLAQNGGYVHVLPRAIAGVAALVPVDDAAAAFAVAGSLVVALIAAFVYAASGDALQSRGIRLGLAGAVLLLPIVGPELYANVVNLHFYLVFACFWALIWQSETRTGIASRSAVAVLAPLSDPVTVLLLPLAIVAPTVRRSTRALAISVAFGSGLVVQGILMRGGESPERNWAFHAVDLPDIFSLRVAGGMFVGDRFLDDAWLSLGRAFSYGTLAALVAVIVVLLVHSDRRTAAFALICLAYAGLFFCVHLAGRGTGGMDPESGSFHLNAARYALLPFLFTVAALLALLDGARFARAPWLRAGALLWLLALLAVNYAVGPNERSSGPRWRDELVDARRTCLSDPARTVHVLVSPAPPEVWYARIPCSRL